MPTACSLGMHAHCTYAHCALPPQIYIYYAHCAPPAGSLPTLLKDTLLAKVIARSERRWKAPTPSQQRRHVARGTWLAEGA